MATAYGRRPSDFVQLETEFGAWSLDEACLALGRRYENMINEGKNPFSDSSVNGSGAYAPAAKANMKRVKIKANGTW
jgi:hypothetical protein